MLFAARFRGFKTTIRSRFTSKSFAAAETRCVHCKITFATAAELSHHAHYHCFPDKPDEPLLQFPIAARVEFRHDQRAKPGVVVGASSNPKTRHACVSVRHVNGVIADVPLSRLRRAAPEEEEE